MICIEILSYVVVIKVTTNHKYCSIGQTLDSEDSSRFTHRLSCTFDCGWLESWHM